ncbi:hypothetical protein BVX94_03735, partial [bacterium B17]
TTPRFRVKVEKKIEEGSTLKVDGEAWLADLKYLGVDLLKADAGVNVTLSPTVSTVTIDPLILLRSGEGLAEVALNVDLKKDIVTFRGDANMNPLAVALITGAFKEDFLDDFRFGQNAYVSAKGVVGYKDKTLTTVNCTIRSDTLDYQKFPFRDCTVNVEVNGCTNNINEIEGKLFGGDVAASGVFVFPPDGSGMNDIYSLHWNLKDADFDAFMSSNLVGSKKKDYEGVFSCEGFLQGPPGWKKRNQLTGGGVLKVRKGRVFMMPVFGGLSRYLTKIIPGLDFVLRQSDADLEFKLAEGKVNCSRVSIKGNVISLKAKGHCTLDKTLDFNVKVTLMKEHTVVGKLLQMLSYPVSKLFEFRLTGTFDDSRWYLENFSKDLLDKLGLTDSESNK